MMASDDHELIQLAVDAFRLRTGWHAELLPESRSPDIGGRSYHAGIRIRGAGVQAYDFIVETKSLIDRRAQLAAAKQQLMSYPNPGLLVAPYVSPALATACREELDLQFLDTLGNAYVNQPSLHVYITGLRPDPTTPGEASTRAGTAAWLRVVFVLLCVPALRSASYRELARAAGVALGSVGPVIQDLEKRGYLSVSNRRDRPRSLVNAARLFTEWVTNYPTRLHPKLHPRRFRSAQPNWWRDANLGPLQAVWSGEVGADRLTSYLKPSSATLYVPPGNRREALQALVTTFQLQADPGGDIEVADLFWYFDDDANALDLAPPLLVYADLMSTLDPRSLEVARLVRDRYLQEFTDDAAHRTA